MKPYAFGKSIRVRHYGSSKFDIGRFDAIRNTDFIKPQGGLWTSPVDSRHSWYDWCTQNDFRLDRLKEFFDLEVFGNILTVHTPADLLCMQWRENFVGVLSVPNFVQCLNVGVDAIHLTEFGERETRFSKPYNLYGWDCETVFILNPRCIAGLRQETDGTVKYEQIDYDPIASLEV